MKAMIFAAGLGTRLRPITNSIPKAMVPVGGKPMLQHLLEKINLAGIKEVVINVHYLPEVITTFLKQNENFGLKIHISDESDELLETGGGLWKAKNLLEGEEPFLLANADVLSNISIPDFIRFHNEHKGIATLAVRNRNSSRKLLFDSDNKLLGRAGDEIPEGCSAFAFSGYHIISPEIFNYNTRSGKFSITDWYMDICSEHAIFAYQHDQDVWIDVGSPEKLAFAEEEYKSGRLN